jgi:hypothetical protein
LTPPEILIYDHFPENPENEYLNESISLDEFELLPQYDVKFFINIFTNRIKCLSHSILESLIEAEDNQFQMEFEAPDDMEMAAYLQTKKSKRIDNAVFVQRDHITNNFVIDISLQSNETVQLRICGNKKGCETYFVLADFQIKPETSIKSAPLYCKTWTFPSKIYLDGPKEANLKIGEEYAFKVIVAASAVALEDSNGTWVYFEKDSSDENVWSLNYSPVVKGSLALNVDLLGNQSFSGAYEYTVKK